MASAGCKIQRARLCSQGCDGDHGESWVLLLERPR